MLAPWVAAAAAWTVRRTTIFSASAAAATSVSAAATSTASLATSISGVTALTSTASATAAAATAAATAALATACRTAFAHLESGANKPSSGCAANAIKKKTNDGEQGKTHKGTEVMSKSAGLLSLIKTLLRYIVVFAWTVSSRRAGGVPVSC